MTAFWKTIWKISWQTTIIDHSTFKIKKFNCWGIVLYFECGILQFASNNVIYFEHYSRKNFFSVKSLSEIFFLQYISVTPSIHVIPNCNYLLHAVFLWELRAWIVCTYLKKLTQNFMPCQMSYIYYMIYKLSDIMRTYEAFSSGVTFQTWKHFVI